MTEPILTICIQTFNRSNYLECLLKALPDCNNFHILVGDYSSDAYHVDQNASMCNKRNHTRYYRSKDGGIDYGFCELMQKASTEYCWLMPDDDVIREEVLPQVLSILDNKKPSLFLVNSSVYNEELTKAIKQRSFTESSFLKVVSPKNISEVEHLLSYIGSCIFNRRLWLRYLDRKNIGTYFNHVYVSEKLLKKGHLILATKLICINIRANNALWTEKSFQIWTENWPLACRSLRDAEAPVRKNLSATTLLYYYVYGALSPDTNKALFQENKLLMLAAVCGRSITSIIIFLTISIKRHSLISEPGYYILKANNNAMSRLLLRRYYDE